MGKKRKRELHSMSPNIPTLSDHTKFSDKTNGSNQIPTEIITISSDEDEPQPKRFNSNQLLGQPKSSRTNRLPTEPKLCQEQQTSVTQPKSPKENRLPTESELYQEQQALFAQPESPKKNRLPTEPELCHEQQALVDLILSGRNVFYTGSAGCGKSTVLKAFVKELKGRNKKVNIIAPTGRAALDINGQTFWTYAGWTPFHMKKNI